MTCHLGKSISKCIYAVHSQIEKAPSQGDLNLGWQPQGSWAGNANGKEMVVGPAAELGWAAVLDPT